MGDIEPGGHYLGTAHTFANFETAFAMPELMDANGYEQWAAEGALDLEARGVNKARQMIAEHEMPPMPDDVLAELDDFVARRESELPDNVS